MAASGARPTFVGDTPTASFDDAETMLAVVRRAEGDLGRFSTEDQATIERFLGALEAIVDNGESEFDDDIADTLLTGTAAFVELFTALDCDGFLGAPGA